MIKKLLKRLRGETLIEDYVKKGMRVGNNFWYGSNCFFDPSHCFLITIGDNVTLSTHVQLLAHDASTIKHIGYAKIGLVNIGDGVFVGANTTILPGVTIGKNTIIGAGSVVTKDCDSESVYAGVPAKKICSIKEYIEKFDEIDKELYFGEEYSVRNNLDEEKKKKMIDKLSLNRIGFIK